MTTRCHSVRSLRSPLCLSRQLSEVAIDRLTTGSPEAIRLTSGSRPRLPTRITLFTEPAISAILSLQSRSPRSFVLCSLHPSPSSMIGDPMPQHIFTAKAPKPFSNYSQGVEVEAGSRLIFVSGQVGVDSAGNLGKTEREQHELAWDNVLRILESAGMTPADIVDCTIYIAKFRCGGALP